MLVVSGLARSALKSRITKTNVHLPENAQLSNGLQNGAKVAVVIRPARSFCGLVITLLRFEHTQVEPTSLRRRLSAHHCLSTESKTELLSAPAAPSSSWWDSLSESPNPKRARKIKVNDVNFAEFGTEGE